MSEQHQAAMLLVSRQYQDSTSLQKLHCCRLLLAAAAMMTYALPASLTTSWPGLRAAQCARPDELYNKVSKFYRLSSIPHFMPPTYNFACYFGSVTFIHLA